VAGVRVALMSRSNDILAEAATGADGLVRFAAPLLRGSGAMEPVAVHASTGTDLVPLAIDNAAFDLSDRGAAGQPHPGSLDAFLWLDRGIYRPGETAHVMALLRDGGGAIPQDVPLRLRLRRPNGQVAAETVLRDGGHWALAIPASAPVGTWKIEALTDPALPPVGEASLRVDAFVPERLAVEMGPAPGPLVPGVALNLPVGARFLYGAPGSGLSGQAELRLSAERSPFPRWAGWVFGLEEEAFAPDLVSVALPETDARARPRCPCCCPAPRHHPPPARRGDADGRRARRPRQHHEPRARRGGAGPAGRAARPGQRGRRCRGHLRDHRHRRKRCPAGGGTRPAPGARAAGLAHRPARRRAPLRDGLDRRGGGRRDPARHRPSQPAAAAACPSAATGSRRASPAAWPLLPCASVPAGPPATAPRCPTRWTSPPTAPPTPPARRRGCASPRPSPAAPASPC
jgi:hypothetical protein